MAYSQFKGQPRLPQFAVPKRYDINLKPDLIACKFAGDVSIDVDIVSPTKFLVLNAADLDVDSNSVSFTPRSASQVRALGIGFVKEDEILVAEFADELPLGVGVLKITFEGILNDKMKGFYRSIYEINGEKRNMAVTQFEATDARRCFPCWDEPAAKATFKLTLVVPNEVIALSNMPVIEEKQEGSCKTVYFEETPIMSTYLVAVVIGLFDYLEDHTNDGVKVRVYCQVGKASQGKFALDVAVKTLELYKNYFAVPYPLPKLDMVAIPDFAAGAMENYGLVTYRETALLYDEKHSAAANKQRVAIVVAHELAHQWFGNLVTMEWWTHLWLNEGFATWVSYLAIDGLFPEWKIWNQFLDETTQGLRLDGLAESHPIEVDINHASEVDEIFDAISYMKGASVIRMLQSYIGAECFQRALASYIKKHAYSNAKTEDLWDAIEKESGEPVTQLMTSWTKQMGYPVLSVKMNDQKLEFEQSQFLLSGSAGDGKWIVPITLCCSSYDTRQNFLLKSKSESIDVRESSWIKVNVDQTGFYRVKYDDKLAAKLRSAIENNQLTPTQSKKKKPCNLSTIKMANDHVKFGQFLLNSPELSGDEDTSSSTDSRRSSASGSGTPPHLSAEMSSPWSQSSSPYTKSPWTKQSPFHSYDHRRNANYTPLGSLIREEGHVYSVASSGEFLYTGSDSRSIRVWSKNQLSDSGGFKSGSGLVKAIVVDPGQGKVFTGHQDGKIRVWKSPNSEQQTHKRVGSLPTWKQLLKSSVDPSKFVEVRRHRRVPRVKHFDAISCLCINHEAGLLYSGSWDKTIKVWRLADGRCLESFAAHDDAVNALAVGFGGLLFSGAADGTVKVWRRELHGKSTRHVCIQTLLEQESAITSLATTTCSGVEGGVLYCGSSDGLVNFWEWNKQLSYGGVLRGHKLPVLCLSAAGSLVFSGSADNCICVWRRDPGGAHVCLAVLTGHAGPVKCLAVEPEGGEYHEDRRWIVYSGSLDKSVKIWRVYENARATERLYD